MSDFPRCAGCRRELEVGDSYIEGNASDYLGRDVEPEIGDLLADLLGDFGPDGRSTGGRIIFCEDCTTEGGDFRLQTYYGDEEE